MARPNEALLRALRETADRLEGGAIFRWTHMGSCNCGHLAQTVTRLSAADIHRRALERSGDWTDQSIEYCGATGYAMDHVFEHLLELGLTTGDLADLERLSGDDVLRTLPPGQRELDKRKREDVVLYLRRWADVLAWRLASGRAIEDVAAKGAARVPARA